MTTMRTEHDSMGPVEVPSEHLWGAQTQRSLHFFHVSTEVMPRALITALVRVKRAAAAVNVKLGTVDAKKAEAIIKAADEVLAGGHQDEFPLSVWQTGSGTQTNMNVNEVLANRASELLGGPRGEGRLVHPNDDVNRSQSSNDTFPTAMNLAAAEAVTKEVLPALEALEAALEAKSKAFAGIVKLGRTHMQDATPVTVGQELSGFASQLKHARAHLEAALPHVCEIALGGTAVGTGLNTPKGYAPAVAAELARLTGLPIVSSPNKFEALATCDALVHLHGALKGLAMSLFKLASDVRLLSSGPRAGLGEWTIPENEPGSSIMPGKVNPTQCEMLTMVAARVLGNDTAISVGGLSGQLQLNVFRPLIADALMQSCRLLAGGMDGFRRHLVEGLAVNEARTAELLGRSLMLVTALTPHIGYELAAKVAHKAHVDGTTLREAAVALGAVSGEDFDRWVVPGHMVGA